MRHTKLLIKASALLAALAVPLAASLPAAAGTSAATVAKLAMHDAVNGRWVHEAVTVRSKGSVAYTLTNVIGETEGTQSMSFANGAIVKNIDFPTKDKAYVYANPQGLIDYMQMRPSTAAKYTDKWLVLTPKTQGENYASVVAGTTLATDFSQFPLTSPSFGPITVIDGHRVRPIYATTSTDTTKSNTKVTLYVTLTPAPLPYRIVEKEGAVSVTATWSKWGQAVSLKEPTNPTPYPG